MSVKIIETVQPVTKNQHVAINQSQKIKYYFVF